MQTTIKIEQATRERLKTFGCKGETYDNILQRLMDELERTMGENPWVTRSR